MRERHANEHVRRDTQPEEDRAIDECRVRDHVRALHEHARKAGGDEQRGGNQAEELSVAGLHFDSRPSSRSRTRLDASDWERRLLLSTADRRSWGITEAGTPET